MNHVIRTTFENYTRTGGFAVIAIIFTALVIFFVAADIIRDLTTMCFVFPVIGMFYIMHSNP